MVERRVPLLLRIAPKLKMELTELAKAEHRSLNQEIEFLLSQAVADLTGRGPHVQGQNKRERTR